MASTQDCATGMVNRFLPKAPTGIGGLDEILEGGLPRGRITLVGGGPGSGKTLLGLEFLYRGALKGEAGIFVGFEEPLEDIRTNAAGLGWDLERLEDDNMLFLLNGRLEAFEPAHVIVDAISACERMGGLQAAFEYLMRLLNNCKEKGVTVVMINQTRGSIDHLEISGNGISSMIDTVVFMNYKEEKNETRRVLQVLKSRGSGHSNRKHPYVITDQGIQIQVGG